VHLAALGVDFKDVITVNLGAEIGELPTLFRTYFAQVKTLASARLTKSKPLALAHSFGAAGIVFVPPIPYVVELKIFLSRPHMDFVT
jgi:hypothetical protein